MSVCILQAGSKLPAFGGCMVSVSFFYTMAVTTVTYLYLQPAVVVLESMLFESSSPLLLLVTEVLRRVCKILVGKFVIVVVVAVVVAVGVIIVVVVVVVVVVLVVVES